MKKSTIWCISRHFHTTRLFGSYAKVSFQGWMIASDVAQSINCDVGCKPSTDPQPQVLFRHPYPNCTNLVLLWAMLRLLMQVLPRSSWHCKRLCTFAQNRRWRNITFQNKWLFLVLPCFVSWMLCPLNIFGWFRTLYCSISGSSVTFASAMLHSFYVVALLFIKFLWYLCVFRLKYQP